MKSVQRKWHDLRRQTSVDALARFNEHLGIEIGSFDLLFILNSNHMNVSMKMFYSRNIINKM